MSRWIGFVGARIAMPFHRRTDEGRGLITNHGIVRYTAYPYTWLFMIIGTLLAGCSPGRLPATDQALETASLAEQEGRVPSSAQVTNPTENLVPTEVLAFTEPGGEEAARLAEPSATPLDLPLRFVFPTPHPAPVSAWRPPSYPVPWAPTPYDHFYFARPIAADEVNWPLQDYRYGGEFFGDVIHTGVDIPAPMHTPVLAVGSGRVIWADYGLYRGGYDETDPYGLAVAIEHDFGYQDQKLYSLYGHLDQVDVVVGQRLATGDRVGLVGETGRVTGPHLHFEVRVGENSFFATRNPELWIAPPEGWGVLAGRIMDTSGYLVERQPIVVTAVDSGQNWFSRSYGPGPAISDAYYQENLVVGDLPAGRYRLRISYGGQGFEQEIEVLPGMVQYFNFYGFDGFELSPPAEPGSEFTPLGN